MTFRVGGGRSNGRTFATVGFAGSLMTNDYRFDYRRGWGGILRCPRLIIGRMIDPQSDMVAWLAMLVFSKAAHPAPSLPCTIAQYIRNDFRIRQLLHAKHLRKAEHPHAHHCAGGFFAKVRLVKLIHKVNSLIAQVVARIARIGGLLSASAPFCPRSVCRLPP